MGNLTALSQASLRPENLNQYRYTLSLLQEGIRIGVLDEPTINHIQIEIASILKDLIRRYTKGESSSVRTETAEKLMNSVFYALDAYMTSFNDPEQSLACLKTESILKIYEKGIRLITLCMADAKMLYREIRQKKLDVPFEVYNTSIDEALPGFFKNYGIVFEAHDTACVLDYPLVFDDMNRQGVYYIRNYLANLSTETEFCRLFNKEDILKLFINYGRLYRIDFQKTPLNIFEVIINNTFFSVLAGNHGSRLDISLSEAEFLRSRLGKKKPAELSLQVDEAFAKIMADLQINGIKLRNYLARYQRLFYPRLLNAVKNDSLLHMIVTKTDPESETGSIAFQTGSKMDELSFEILIQHLMAMSDIGEKIDQIVSNVHSVEDFMDLFQADCLYGDEFGQLFNVLGDVELAVLGKVVFFDELRDEHLDLSVSSKNKKQFDKEWQSQYCRFIQNLNQDRINTIEGLIIRFSHETEW